MDWLDELVVLIIGFVTFTLPYVELNGNLNRHIKERKRSLVELLWDTLPLVSHYRTLLLLDEYKYKKVAKGLTILTVLMAVSVALCRLFLPGNELVQLGATLVIWGVLASSYLTQIIVYWTVSLTIGSKIWVTLLLTATPMLGAYINNIQLNKYMREAKEDLYFEE